MMMLYWLMMIYFFDEDYGNVTFSSDEMGILSVNLNNINLDIVNFDKDDFKTIIHVRFMAWRNRYKQRKTYKRKIRAKHWCL